MTPVVVLAGQEPVAVGDGVRDDRAALARAAVRAHGGVLDIAPGAYRIAADLDLATALRFSPGARLVPDEGVTVTVNAPVEAGLHHIFDLSSGGAVTGRIVAPELPVTWWGADGIGHNGDDTAAFQAALAVAALSPVGGFATGRRVRIPAGTYNVGKIKCLDMHGVQVFGDGILTWLYADQQTGAPEPVFDVLGSGGMHFSGFSVLGMNGAGQAPTVTPKSAFQLASWDGVRATDKTTMRDVGAQGHWRQAALLIAQHTNGNYFSSQFINWSQDGHAVALTSGATLQISGAAEAISSANGTIGGLPVCNEHQFFGCEFHAQSRDPSAGTYSGAGTGSALYLSGAHNISFFGCLHDTDRAAAPHVRAAEVESRNCQWIGGKFYAEPFGANADCVLFADGVAAKNFAFRSMEVSTPTANGFACGVNGGSAPGLIIDGLRPRSQVKGSLVGDAAAQRFGFGAVDSAGVLLGGTARWFGTGSYSSASPGHHRMRVPCDGVIVGIWASANVSPGAGQSHTAQLLVNGGGSPSIFTSIANAQNEAEAPHVVQAVNRGDLLEMQVSSTAGAAGAISFWADVGFIAAGD